MLNFKNFLNTNIREVVNLILISKSTNRKLTYLLYIIFLFILVVIGYFLSPKFIDYSSRQELITDTLKAESRLQLQQFSEIHYKIFPSPRLVLKEASFVFNEGLVVTNESDFHIILKVKKLLSFKSFDFKSILIKNSNSKINFRKINTSINTLKKNKKKLLFEDSKFIFSDNTKDFFKIENSKLLIKNMNSESIIKLNGLLLNENFFINFVSTTNNKNNLSIKIPGIDSSIKVFFENDKNNKDTFTGFTNIEILNNFLQFDFKKDDKYKIENGYVRNHLINTSIEGFLTFEPNLYFYLDLKPNMFNIKKIFSYSLEKYLLPDIKKLNLIKKLNGEINLDFKNLFNGKIIFENGAILLEDLKIIKNGDLITVNTYMEDLKQTKKIAFNLSKQINDKKKPSKLINIKGLLIPSKNKVIFKEIFVNDKPLGKEEVEFYEKEFEKKILSGSINNFFTYKRVDKYFNNF